MNYGARGFLKRTGFLTDKSHAQIDKALLRLLDGQQRERITEIWHFRELGISDGLEQYMIPTSVQQAAVLWSHDWPRFEAGFEWIARLVEELKPSSVLDVGAGPGFLIGFLSTHFPDINYAGIDSCENFVAIGKEFCRGSVILGDYLTEQPTGAFELTVCNYGFDNSSFTPSYRDHGSARIGLGDFCPNCSDDMLEQCRPYIAAWRKWSTLDGSLALVGRVKNFGEVRAWLLAAADAGWKLDRELTETIRTKSLGGMNEKFPAMLFRTSEVGAIEEDLDWISRIYI